MKGVKVLRPEYIRDCKKSDACLDEKDYMHKLCQWLFKYWNKYLSL